MKLSIYVIAISLIFTFSSLAFSENLKGTWSGQNPKNGKWKNGPWKLRGNAMYFNGRNSACNGTRVPIKVTKSGNRLNISGKGCLGIVWKCSIKVGSKKLRCQNINNPYKTKVYGVRGW